MLLTFQVTQRFIIDKQTLRARNCTRISLLIISWLWQCLKPFSRLIREAFNLRSDIRLWWSTEGFKGDKMCIKISHFRTLLFLLLFILFPFCFFWSNLSFPSDFRKTWNQGPLSPFNFLSVGVIFWYWGSLKKCLDSKRVN